MEITARLADHAANLEYERLTLEVVEKAKQCILDVAGIAIRARFDAESSEPITVAVKELAGSGGKCTAIGNREDFPTQYAALLNGTYAHTLDFDDTHRRGSIHPGASIIPGALAVAEEAGASGKALIAGVVAGYDVTCRVSEAAGPRAHYDHGFHPTATAGTFGTTAAGARILGMSSLTLQDAFGLNGSQAAGSMQFLENGGWNKRVHPGLAAHNAVYALKFAQKGFIGASNPLEGPAGFFKSYSDAPEPERALLGLGEQYSIADTAFKPYPSCRFTHTPLDLILEMVHTEDISATDIEGITIGLAQKGIDIVGVPADRKRRPQSIVDGQFSMHFTAAVAAAHRRMTWDDYDKIKDPSIVSLMDRIEVVHDPACQAEYPDKFAGSVEIRARGERFSRFSALAKGEPENPLSWEEVVGKFHDLASVGFDRRRRDKIVEAIRGLESAADVREVMNWFRP